MPSVFGHQLGCCPPTISSITSDHDEFIDSLSLKGASSLISRPVTVRTIARFRDRRTGVTVFLTRLYATTELPVINLIPQHDPQSDPESASDGHTRLAKPFWINVRR